jgi:hypothetical protein
MKNFKGREERGVYGVIQGRIGKVKKNMAMK